MKKKRFEGWYFKLVSKELTMAFIPEISAESEEKGALTGSLQVVFADRSYYLTYNHAVSLRRHFYVVLGKNVFTDACISVNLSVEDISINGILTFEDCGAKRFNVMGPLRFFPMPCKHAILTMEKKVSGTLKINGKDVSFGGGTLYLEKDWGTSFPRSYMWTQCGDFDGEGVRISAAIAEMPLIDLCGCYACIEYKGKKYKLATYQGARAEVMELSGFRIRQRGLVFEGKVIHIKASGGVKLKSPINAQMTEETTEYLKCTVEYRLHRNGEEIFTIRSSRASYEFR